MTKFIHPFGATHYVDPRPRINDGRNPMVKEADYFMDQKGHIQDWGSGWIPVRADGLSHAQLLAWFIGSKTQFPCSIVFTPPIVKTVRELRDEGFVWGREYEK